MPQKLISCVYGVSTYPRYPYNLILIPFRVEGKVSDAIRVSMATEKRHTTHLLQSVVLFS